MKTIHDSQQFISTEFFVLDVDEKGVCVECKHQVEDILINSPEGDVLLSWDFPHGSSFPDDHCILLPGKNDLKEINRMMFTRLGLKSVHGIVKIYVVFQRN